jgi:hypothetical protein
MSSARASSAVREATVGDPWSRKALIAGVAVIALLALPVWLIAKLF